MAKIDISPLQEIFHSSIIASHLLMNKLLKISKYFFHHLASVYRIFDIPAPFLTFLLCSAPDKSVQSSLLLNL